jgi:hypothetical protein
MTPVDIIFALLFWIGIAYLGFWRFRQLRIDSFRQNIFSIRDELFIYAAEGHIGFDHPAYTTLRNMLNGYIRFSHQISLLRLLAHWLSVSIHKPKLPQFSNFWAEAIADLPDEKKAKLEHYLTDASAHLFYFLFLSTIAKKALAIPAVAAVLIRFAFSNSEKDDRPIIITSAHGVKVFEQKRELKVATYQYTEKHSEQVKDSIDHLNADAVVYGKRGQFAAV